MRGSEIVSPREKDQERERERERERWWLRGKKRNNEREREPWKEDEEKGRV